MKSIRERALESVDIKQETFHVDAWDVDVIVKGMNARERIAFIAAQQARKMQEAIIRVVICCTLDPETGAPVFTQADEELLPLKNGTVIEALFVKIASLSGISEDAVKAAKNASGASEDSSSDLPETLAVQ